MPLLPQLVSCEELRNRLMRKIAALGQRCVQMS